MMFIKNKMQSGEGKLFCWPGRTTINTGLKLSKEYYTCQGGGVG